MQPASVGVVPPIMVYNDYEVYAVAVQVPIYAAYMVVVPVYVLEMAEVEIDVVYVLVDDIQATTMLHEVLDVIAVAENIELQLVDISYVLDIIVEQNVQAGSFEDAVETKKLLSNVFKELLIF